MAGFVRESNEGGNVSGVDVVLVRPVTLHTPPGYRDNKHTLQLSANGGIR